MLRSATWRHRLGPAPGQACALKYWKSKTSNRCGGKSKLSWELLQMVRSHRSPGRMVVAHSHWRCVHWSKFTNTPFVPESARFWERLDLIDRAKRDEAISALLFEHILAGDFPSAVYVVGQRGRIVFADALGDAVREPQQIPATLETIYDLASLTKPMITGLLCARLVERGGLTLDSPVAKYLREFNRQDKNRITVRDLVTHTSGLPAWRPLYILTGGDPKTTVSAMARVPLEQAPGRAVLYSALGFIV